MVKIKHWWYFMSNKNIRIIDIAKLANVSTGTVDRVIHNRGKVSEEKKKRIEQAIKDLNYEPNLIARSLATKRPYKIIALIPQFEKGEYWEKVSDGIQMAEKELSRYNINVGFLFYDQYDKVSFEKAARELANNKVDGVLLSTLFGDMVKELSVKLDNQKIPYVYIDANITEQQNLSYFGVDSYYSGKIAAKLLLKEIGKDSDILIGNYHSQKAKPSTQISIRENGFLDQLKADRHVGKIHYLDYSNMKINNAGDLKKLLSDYSSEMGCIVFNSRIYELIELLEKENIDTQKIHFIGYDTVEKNIELLKKSKLSFLISQQSEMQGYNGTKALANYLLINKLPEKINYMPIDILIKENIDFYNKVHIS